MEGAQDGIKVLVRLSSHLEPQGANQLSPKSGLIRKDPDAGKD